MKKTLLFLLCLIMTACTVACNKSDGKKSVVVEYGQTVVVPNFGNGEYKLKNGSGKEVELVNGEFRATDMSGYKLRYKGAKKASVDYTVTDTTGPEIKTEFDVKYFIRGSKLVLPSVVAYDLRDGNVQTKQKLYYGEEELNISGDFSFEKTGSYRLEISATDSSGNASVKTVYYEITDEIELLTDVVAAFSSEYGVNHTGNLRGAEASYTTDVHYDRESGSTNLYINGDSWFMTSFVLARPLISDLTSSAGFVFRVYNDLDVELNCSLNWTVFYFLPPKRWSEIYVGKKEFDTFSSSPQELLAAKSNMTDVNGLFFAFFRSDNHGIPRGNIYLSNVCRVKNYSASELNGIIKSLPSELSDDDMFMVNNIRNIYGGMDDWGKMNATEYAGFIKRYGDYLFSKYDVEKDLSKLVYFDSELAFEQIDYTGATLSVADAPDGEGKAMRAVSLSDWSVKLSIKLVFSEREKLFGKMSMRVFCPTSDNYNFFVTFVNDAEGYWDTMQLESGWNDFVISGIGGGKGGKAVTDGYILIECGPKDAPAGEGRGELLMPSGLEFFLTPLMGRNS